MDGNIVAIAPVSNTTGPSIQVPQSRSWEALMVLLLHHYGAFYLEQKFQFYF